MRPRWRPNGNGSSGSSAVALLSAAADDGPVGDAAAAGGGRDGIGGIGGKGGDFCAAAVPPLAGASAATPGKAARHSIVASSAPNAIGMTRKRTNWLGIRTPEKSWFMALDGARWHG